MAAASDVSFPFFHPPGCPRPECRGLPPRPDLLSYFRSYATSSYPGGIALFRCSRCRRSFSLRRFSVEFYLHRHHRTVAALEQLVSSCSLRQAARASGSLGRAALARRLERFGLHAHRLLRRALRERLPVERDTFVLDEAETFEIDRRMGPLTVPVLLHRRSRYVLAAHVGTLAPRIRPSDRRWRPRLERALLPRRNQSRRVASRCLAALDRVRRGAAVVLATDEKPAYRSLLRQHDRGTAVTHRTTSSRVPRRTWNPLFQVNQTLAMVRDGLSRARRRTWCASKRRGRLWCHLGLYFAWKNFVRLRTNEAKETPAQAIGLTKRRWGTEDLVRWRLDLGRLSLSPWVPEPATRS